MWLVNIYTVQTKTVILSEAHDLRVDSPLPGLPAPSRGVAQALQTKGRMKHGNPCFYEINNKVGR